MAATLMTHRPPKPSPLSKESNTIVARSTSPFKAPQHTAAHHLHSLPPREKTTRSLIIDDFLAHHSRTRFQQARAELQGDHEAARTLRATADGVEKVLGAILAQPCSIAHHDEDDEPNEEERAELEDPYHLPNGVRLRLVLAIVVNELFGRSPASAPPPPPALDKPHQAVSIFSFPCDVSHSLCPRHLRSQCLTCGYSNTIPLSSIGSGLPRALSPLHTPSFLSLFLRLSALIAAERGFEAGASRPAIPTKEWHSLLLELTTRTVLAGYRAYGWRGRAPAERLFELSLPDENRNPSSEFQYDPDRMPRVKDALSLLLLQDNDESNPNARWFRAELGLRRVAFLEDDKHSADLGSHLTALTAQYLPSVDDLERAALHFCEAVAQWRGATELEGLRKPPPKTSISSLLAPITAASPALTSQTVDRYFTTATLTRPRDIGDEGPRNSPKRARLS